MKIKIMSVEFELIESDPAGWVNNRLGQSNIQTCQIILDVKLPETMKMTVLMHEIIHAIVDMNDLPRMDDVMVSGLANPLFDFLRQNPELVKRIAGIKDE